MNGLGGCIISSETEEPKQKRKRRSTEDSCQYGKPPNLYCDVKNVCFLINYHVLVPVLRRVLGFLIK